MIWKNKELTDEKEDLSAQIWKNKELTDEKEDLSAQKC